MTVGEAEKDSSSLWEGCGLGEEPHKERRGEEEDCMSPLTVQAFSRVLNIKVTEDQNCLSKESSDSSERWM